MENGKKISLFLFSDTLGAIATANFLICVFSGIFLAIPYNVEQPYESLGNILITNPWATFFRNIHYWSGQLFLIFVILHIWDYIKSPHEIKTRKGIWFRLVISVLVTLFVMLTGFILKGDADSLQARRIFESLISGLPLMGNFLVNTLFGKEGDFQLIYVHHIATATIFLLIVVFEHVRKIWVNPLTFFVILLFLSLFGFLFQAPLHNNLHQVVKGPWYLVGLQEVLHWMRHPSRILIFISLILVVLYFIPRYLKFAPAGKRIILYAFYMYLVFTVAGYFFRGENWNWIWPWEKGYARQIYIPFKPDPIRVHPGIRANEIRTVPFVLGRAESCLICHDQVTGFSTSHDPNAIGCVSCHGGNSFSSNKNSAHSGMMTIPGNLHDASVSCGTSYCHPQIPGRVQKSIMSTLSGMISIDRFVFGECEKISSLANIHDLKQTPADNHLRDLCAACHLGNIKTDVGPITERSRGGGCNACHLNYDTKALLALEKYLASSKADTAVPGFHPQLSVNITDGHCFGCHSRSGRISASYEGWHETFLTEADIQGNQSYRVLEDKRVFQYVAADVHHQKGMECIDCHVSYELMGDGNLYHHKEQQVRIQCEDCHTSSPIFIPAEEIDQETNKILRIRKFYPADGKILKGVRSGTFFPNISLGANDSLYLLTKNSGTIHPVLPPSQSICTAGDAHSRISCSTCHTAWAPRCVGCHTAYEPSSTGYDLYEKRFIHGTWVEYAGKYEAVPPTLGVEYDMQDVSMISSRIKTAIPGMILTIDKSEYPGKEDTESLIFHRLYAPIEAHTIQKQGRSCRSCHLDPVTMGYGEGVLEYRIDSNRGYWIFMPRYSNNEHDGLPEDAWIGFLSNQDGLYSTRDNFRPFNLPEQRKILTVGSCLSCHDEDSPIMNRSLTDFRLLLNQVSRSCILPTWD